MHNTKQLENNVDKRQNNYRSCETQSNEYIKSMDILALTKAQGLGEYLKDTYGVLVIYRENDRIYGLKEPGDWFYHRDRDLKNYIRQSAENSKEKCLAESRF